MINKYPLSSSTWDDKETEAIKNIFSMLEPKEFVLFGGPYEGPWGDYIKSQGISPKLIGGFNR